MSISSLSHRPGRKKHKTKGKPKSSRPEAMDVDDEGDDEFEGEGDDEVEGEGDDEVEGQGDDLNGDVQMKDNTKKKRNK